MSASPSLEELQLICNQALVDPTGTAKLFAQLYGPAWPTLEIATQMMRAAEWTATALELYERTATPFRLTMGPYKVWFGPARCESVSAGEPYLTPAGMRALGRALLGLLGREANVVRMGS